LDARGRRSSSVALLLIMLLDCFFFQAEDGIRARNVTGVQTCALPILISIRRFGPAVRMEITENIHPRVLEMLKDELGIDDSEIRSEERRVGKESRDRRTRGERTETRTHDKSRRNSRNGSRCGILTPDE